VRAIVVGHACEFVRSKQIQARFWVRAQPSVGPVAWVTGESGVAAGRQSRETATFASGATIACGQQCTDHKRCKAANTMVYEDIRCFPINSNQFQSLLGKTGKPLDLRYAIYGRPWRAMGQVFGADGVAAGRRSLVGVQSTANKSQGTVSGGNPGVLT